MYSEIPDRVARQESKRPCVLYDDDCSFCTRLIRRLSPTLQRHGYAIAPLQAGWVGPALGLPTAELLREMRVLEADGTCVSGAAAVARLSRCIWWARPIQWLANWPAGMGLLDRGYKWIAKHRTCGNEGCAAQPARTPGIWPWLTFVLLLVFVAKMSYGAADGWVVMWGIAGAIWLWVKLFTLREVRSADKRLGLGYLFAWPGTDAWAFFRGEATTPPLKNWLSGTLNLACGITLLVIAPHISGQLASGWTAMIGLVFALHFGAFRLLSCVWRSQGVDARPVMDNPLCSVSLGDFWGRRWNTGFSTPARRHLFEPLKRKVGPTIALACVFLASGVIHELAISVPARGGYGLPTLYFAFQGAAILFERSKAGQRLRLGRGARGRAFALLCAAAPAFWLFHPPFVEHVILPFLGAIHSARGALL